MPFLPNLFSCIDLSTAEKSNAGETQVLMGHEHPDGKQVGLAEVVDEATDVAVESGVDTINFSIL